MICLCAFSVDIAKKVDWLINVELFALPLFFTIYDFKIRHIERFIRKLISVFNSIKLIKLSVYRVYKSLLQSRFALISF